MTAMVTGGTGFVGRHLVEALRQRGMEVTALVRSRERAAPLSAAGARLVLGDLEDRGALALATTGAQVVYHVAGVTAARNESHFHRINAGGTTNVLAAALDAAVPRFVLVSSLAAAGPSSPGHPVRGTEQPKPVTAYGRSKLAAEAAVRASSLAWTIVRPPIVYGPYDREVLRLFKAVRLGIAPIFGSGMQELSAVYGPDLAEALIAAGTSERGAGRTYIACHPIPFRSAEFIAAIGQAVGSRVRLLRVPRVVARPLLHITAAAARLGGRTTLLTPDKANEFFQAAWTGDPTSLIEDTGWQAGHDLASGLAATAAWYREAGWM